MMMYTPSNTIDLFSRGKKVAEFDATSTARAGDAFAKWWNAGILERSFLNSAPAPTADEVFVISSRGELPGCEGHAFDSLDFRTRYYDAQGRACYPQREDSDTYKNESADALRHRVNKMCTRAVASAGEHRRAQLKPIIARLPEIHADRYAEGLERVRRLKAGEQLRDEISSIKDDSLRLQLEGEFAELYTTQAAEQMAEQVRLQTYEADVQAWNEAHEAD